MSVYTMRLVLGVMFLILGTVILTRSWFAPGLGQGFDPVRLNLGGVFSLVFGGLNIARWYTMRAFRRARATPVRTSLQPDPSAVRPQAPIPEFDFTKDDCMNETKDENRYNQDQ